MPNYASEAWQGSLPQAEAQINRRPGRQRSTCATVKFVGGVNVKRALALELSVKSVHVIRALLPAAVEGSFATRRIRTTPPSQVSAQAAAQARSSSSARSASRSEKLRVTRASKLNRHRRNMVALLKGVLELGRCFAGRDPETSRPASKRQGCFLSIPSARRSSSCSRTALWITDFARAALQRDVEDLAECNRALRQKRR